MTTLELSGLILAVEFALVAWGMLFFALHRRRKRIHEDHAHAGAVIKHLESDEVSRRDALASLFETTYRLEGEDLASKVDEYVAREKAFYSAMLSLYLNRDGAKLKQIPEELAKVLTPWVSMTPTGMVHASDISDLENEKANLAAELNDTKNTLEQLMDEYMAAFKRSQGEPEAAADSTAPPPPPPTAEPKPESDDEATLEDDAEGEDAPTDALAPTAEESVAPEPVADAMPETSAADEPSKKPSEADDSPSEVEEQPEGPIDQAELDAMLSAFGTDNDSTAKESDAGPGVDDEEQARQELEGLADLFGEADGPK